MTTPPNRPQIQRPTLEDCRIVEMHLRTDAIAAAKQGETKALNTLLWRYTVLALLNIVTQADCDALYHHCRAIAAQHTTEAA